MDSINEERMQYIGDELDKALKFIELVMKDIEVLEQTHGNNELTERLEENAFDTWRYMSRARKSFEDIIPINDD